MNSNYYLAIEFPEDIKMEIQFPERSLYQLTIKSTPITLGMSGHQVSQIPGRQDTTVRVFIPTENNNKIIGLFRDWLDYIVNSHSFIQCKGNIAAIDTENIFQTRVFHGVWPLGIDDGSRILGAYPPDNCQILFNVDYDSQGIDDYFKFIKVEKLTYEFCFDIITRYPKLINYVPDRFQDQEMILASKIS